MAWKKINWWLYAKSKPRADGTLSGLVIELGKKKGTFQIRISKGGKIRTRYENIPSKTEALRVAKTYMRRNP